MPERSRPLSTSDHDPFPYFVNGLRPKELWVLYRDEKGFTQAQRAYEMEGVKEFMENGAQLGHLWMEGYFSFGDPLTNAGGPKIKIQKKPARIKIRRRLDKE